MFASCWIFLYGFVLFRIWWITLWLVIDRNAGGIEYMILWCMLDMHMIVMCESTLIVLCIYYYLKIFLPFFLCCYICASLEYTQSGTWVGAWCWGWYCASLIACRLSLIVGVTLICNMKGIGYSFICFTMLHIFSLFGYWTTFSNLWLLRLFMPTILWFCCLSNDLTLIMWFMYVSLMFE